MTRDDITDRISWAQSDINWLRGLQTNCTTCDDFTKETGAQAFANVLVEPGLDDTDAHSTPGEIGFEFADAHAAFSPVGLK